MVPSQRNLGCLRRQTSPDSGVTTFACDKAGNITSKTDARGITVTYGYDAAAGGNEGIGRLTAAQNDGADIALTYDARGNVIADTRTIAGHTYTTQYSYDAAGRVYARRTRQAARCSACTAPPARSPRHPAVD